tara:strand:- start:150 stop:320 length:171 start_codon:yes stop_codon:yes gene_type:complete
MNWPRRGVSMVPQVSKYQCTIPETQSAINIPILEFKIAISTTPQNAIKIKIFCDEK